MTSKFVDEITKIASIDLFSRDEETGMFNTGIFVGRPFHLNYESAHLLVADSWKQKANGIPQGAFLLAYYEREDSVSETLLLRVLRPTKLPTDSDVISSMIEYYKDGLKTTGKGSQLDTFTRYEFSFSGMECRVLGTFYKDNDGNLCYGADVENFYSAINYSVVKPNEKVLELIANFREGKVTSKPSDITIGKIRYSSTMRFQESEGKVPVYVTPLDFLGKRSALFGMTRTGKSNTVKKLIQANVLMNDSAPHQLSNPPSETVEDMLEPLVDNGFPKYPAGQIIFDINGEYANPNLQDKGTAIYELYESQTQRFSTIDKGKGFQVMKVNFYNDILSGFKMVKGYLDLTKQGDYVKAFISTDLSEPDFYSDFKSKVDFSNPDYFRKLKGLLDSAQISEMTRYERKVAAYKCCLYKAGFTLGGGGNKIYFPGCADVNNMVAEDGSVVPDTGITFDHACLWFEAVWDNHDSHKYFESYKKKKGRPWADEDLQAVLVFLTRKRESGAKISLSGWKTLTYISDRHTNAEGEAYDIKILNALRAGGIVIVDLSQGEPDLQRLYSEKICEKIFSDSMDRFIKATPNNFIQFYFEEAHNLFPKKDDKDLSQIYNRLAKEGAKLHLGMIYATQEVSSISSNILKNTQNWFIAHLNNDDETKEIKKYYDFGDFVEGLVRFSASNDKGYVRMKTYSNPFVVPVQVDRFPE